MEVPKEKYNMVEHVTTIKLSDVPYIILPEKVGHQLRWHDGQQVRITPTGQGLVLVSETTSDEEVPHRFEQVLEAYQATGDQALVDALLDMVEGCMGEAAPDEYDPNLKWGGYYEGR